MSSFKQITNIFKGFKGLKGVQNIKAPIDKLLHNRVFLYVVFAFALLNMLVFFVANDFRSIAIFFIVGFLTSFLCKNMVVVLLLSIVIVNILKYGVRINEGLENDEKTEKEENFEEKEEENFEENLEDDEKMKDENFEEHLEDEEHEQKKKKSESE